MTFKIPLDKGYTVKRIIACTTCKSTGVRECSELENYHRGEYEYWKELCSMCWGEGRVVEVTHKSRVALELPNGTMKLSDIEGSYQEPLNGRKTSDIYKIGRDA
jgi:DnaJ-class molecular chaperone